MVPVAVDIPASLPVVSVVPIATEFCLTTVVPDIIDKLPVNISKVPASVSFALSVNP